MSAPKMQQVTSSAVDSPPQQYRLPRRLMSTGQAPGGQAVASDQQAAQTVQTQQGQGSLYNPQQPLRLPRRLLQPTNPAPPTPAATASGMSVQQRVREALQDPEPQQPPHTTIPGTQYAATTRPGSEATSRAGTNPTMQPPPQVRALPQPDTPQHQPVSRHHPPVIPSVSPITITTPLPYMCSSIPAASSRECRQNHQLTA